MRLSSPRVDPDPLPRAAPVGPGSAYAGVAAASPVVPNELGLTETPLGEVPLRRQQTLRDWRLRIGNDNWRAVAVPHVWSRAEPDLVDYKGPCRYQRRLPGGAGYRQLRFGGLDYTATVHLDGARAVCHEGGFTPVTVELPEEPVEVSVDVDDPIEVGLLGPEPLAAAKRKVKGVFEFHDSRPGGAIFSLAWSPLWARRWGTGGIVEPVTLLTTGPVRIDAAFATAGPDRLGISWVLTNLSPTTVRIKLRAGVHDVSAPSSSHQSLIVEADLPAGPGRISVLLDAADAASWAPGHGRLYRLVSEVGLPTGVSDTSTVHFGVRDVAMSLRPDGTEFQLKLDGRRHYVRAANYIPGVWLPELSEAVLRRDIELAQAAHLNSLGPHAHVLPERFYDLADAYGLCVYQDFPLNLAHDLSGEPLFDRGPNMAEASLLLATEMALRLFNHPSVVYYACHNEPAFQLGEAFRGGTSPEVVRMREAFEAAPHEEGCDLQRAALLNTVDPTRPAFFASGVGRSRPVGDAHSYSGSLNTDPTTTIAETTAAFLSEFGAWTANFSAAADVTPARGDWPPGPDGPDEWDRQTHFYGAQAMRAGRPERYPDFPSWTYAGQLWAGAFIKLGVESFRRRMWDPFAGHRYHLFVDHWGGAGAGVVDRHRLPQFHYWALAAANRPLLPVVQTLPSMRTEAGRTVSLPTWIIDDRAAAAGRCLLRWAIRRLPAAGYYLIGVDDPQVPDAFGPRIPPVGDLVVLPRSFGEELDSGRWEFTAKAATSQSGPELEFTVPPGSQPAAYLVHLTLETGEEAISNWGAFLAAPAAWTAPPGLTDQPKFSLTLSGRGDYRLVRRWTGQTIRSGTAHGTLVLSDLSPDQYLLVAATTTPIDLYSDVTAELATGAAICQGDLPWWFDARGGE